MAPIPARESLTVEFKSDVESLPDSELVAAVICMANAEGGELYIGVENDGLATGLHARHMNIPGVVALIANRTTPSLSVRAEGLPVNGVTVACIHIPKSEAIISSSEGLIQRRRIQADGTPVCVPFYPFEFARRHSDLRRLDYSAIPMEGARTEDLDPMERQRLRTLIERYGGDSTLLGLSDEDLDGALGLVTRDGKRKIPTVAGMLTIGREQAIRTHLPTHELAVQELSGTQVRLNKFLRLPLLALFERVYEQYFMVRVVEEEVQTGLFRVPVPNYDGRAFREALVNALVHRDYTRLGAVHIRWKNDGLTLSNPGGFVEGVTLENLLITEPRPRNPLLADVMKRVGLAERTGRGVDLIFQGLLRYGRPAPDYGRSDVSTVVLRFSDAAADLRFLELIMEEERRTNAPMPIDALIALSQLQSSGRLTAASLASYLQKDEAGTRILLGRLLDAGLIEARGPARSREVTLSAAVYRRLGRAAEYIHQTAFDEIQQEQMVLQYVSQHGHISRGEAAELCRLSRDQSSRLLRRLASAGKLRLQNAGRGARYLPV